MSKFVHENFEEFQIEFEKTFRQKICHWINDNIEIKEGKNSRRIEVPKNFACYSLLNNPDSSFIKLCDRLFSDIKNLNGRTTHKYLANQVHGTLQEALHKYKLEKKYPKFDFSFLCSEFNKSTKKREIYTNTNLRRVTRDADLKFSCPQGDFKIHIKANNKFRVRPQLTFRGGGKISEFEKIKNAKSDYLHILVSPNQYISIPNFDSFGKYIHSSKNLSTEESRMWGGLGAHRIVFNQNIFQTIKSY